MSELHGLVGRAQAQQGLFRGDACFHQKGDPNIVQDIMMLNIGETRIPGNDFVTPVSISSSMFFSIRFCLFLVFISLIPKL